MDERHDPEELIDLLRGSRQTVVFTGAGVSTLSGIPDFRGRQGLNRTIDAERVFNIDVFRRDPAVFYTATAELFYDLDRRQPSLVHRECARLEAAGLVAAVVTQNIDMLHQRAGSKQVIELHGSPKRHDCLDCGAVYDYEWARRFVEVGNIPRCERCGAAVKPAVTFYGEMLEAGPLKSAVAAAAGAAVMLVLGSSLVVQPAASIPLQTVKCGGKLAIINDGETPLDRHAAFRHDDLEICFEAIAAAV